MTRPIAAVFALLGIAAPLHAETLLQIDYGWRTDGERACTSAFIESAPWRRIACVNPIEELENFAQTMDTQFSSNPSCHGITLFRFPWGPMPLDKSAEIYKRPHWMFFIFAYAPGDEKQSWKLTDPDRESVFAGEGIPKEIVQEVCGVVVGKGGSVVR
jgi:hypothetical protein